MPKEDKKEKKYKPIKSKARIIDLKKWGDA